jgi:hypothetical protein
MAAAEDIAKQRDTKKGDSPGAVHLESSPKERALRIAPGEPFFIAAAELLLPAATKRQSAKN